MGKNNNLFSIKILLIYGITFSIGYWISTIIIPLIRTNNLFAIYLLTGIILELSAKTCQMILHKKPKISIDKRFILWTFIHSIVAYGIVFIIEKISISNKYLFILLVGFGIAIITHIIWRFMYGEKSSKQHTSGKRINLLNLIKIPLALFTIFVLISSIYFTFTSFSIGLFIPPIICIAIAGSIIRFFDRSANGKEFLWNTLALAGVFLIIVAMLLYQIFAPIFELFG